MLDREEFTPRSDLASVGYVLVELLAGKPLFAGIREYANLLEAKRTLPQRLHKILPPEVTHSELLMRFAAGSPHPTRCCDTPRRNKPIPAAKAWPSSNARSCAATWPVNTRTNFAFGWRNWIENRLGAEA